MVVRGSSRAPVHAVLPPASESACVDRVIPVIAHGETVGTVVYRQHKTAAGEMYLEVCYRGIVALVPCRRKTDVLHPDRVYVLEDGRLWFAEGQASAPSPIVAEIEGSLEPAPQSQSLR